MLSMSRSAARELQALAASDSALLGACVKGTVLTAGTAAGRIVMRGADFFKSVASACIDRAAGLGSRTAAAVGARRMAAAASGAGEEEGVTAAAAVAAVDGAGDESAAWPMLSDLNFACKRS